jgi:hypothetical protein
LCYLGWERGTAVAVSIESRLAVGLRDGTAAFGVAENEEGCLRGSWTGTGEALPFEGTARGFYIFG